MSRRRQVASPAPTQVWLLLPPCPSTRDPGRPQHPPDPKISLTSFLTYLPTANHYHTPLALPPKQTSHAPHRSPPHGTVLAPYLSSSYLEICLHPSPPVHPPHQSILPKYKPDHVIPLLKIQWLPIVPGSSPPTLPSLALQPHPPECRSQLHRSARQSLQRGAPLLPGSA